MESLAKEHAWTKDKKKGHGQSLEAKDVKRKRRGSMQSGGAFQQRVRVNLFTVGEVQVVRVRTGNGAQSSGG